MYSSKIEHEKTPLSIPEQEIKEPCSRNNSNSTKCEGEDDRDTAPSATIKWIKKAGSKNDDSMIQLMKSRTGQQFWGWW